MSDQEELRDDVPRKEDDETWEMGDPSEEGQERDQQDSGDSRSEVDRVAEIEEQAEEETTPAAETEWDENEPSPHQGEEGQQESEA